MRKQTKPNLSPAAAEMRRLAEERLQKQHLSTGRARIETNPERLVHELEVHQIELEMQNEELRKARDVERSALEKYSELYDFAPVGYLTLDREGMAREANLASARLLGIERSRLVKQRLVRFVAAADQRTFTAFLTKVFQSKVSECCEVTLLKEGKSSIEVRIEAVVAASGRECRAVLEDITELKRAEAALRQFHDKELKASRSEVEFEHDKLWKLASNPFMVLGEARVTGSGVALTILGDLPPEPRLGLAAGSFPKTIAEALAMMHADDRQSYQEAVEHSLTTGEPFDMNYRLADGHGGWRWIEGRAVSVEVLEGKHVGWVFTNRDISERKQAQEVLQRSDQKFRRLYDSMMDAFVVVDMTGQIQEFNSMYQALLGYSEAELRQMTYVELTPEGWHACEAGIIQDQVLRTGFSEVYEKEYRRKDGTVFPVELRTFLLRDETGQATGMWAIVRDISERKKREAALRQSLRELEASRSELKSEQDRLWKLAANAFSVLGEVRVTEDGAEQNLFGDSPEAKVGLAQAVPKSIDRFMDMIHPDDVRSYQQKVERSVATGQPFRTIYRLSDGRGGWRWLQD